MHSQGLSQSSLGQLPDSPCVLVVEDDELIQARLELLIEAAGLAAVSVPSAKKARAALAAVFFPIVIVDRILEDGDGIDLCDEVRRQQAHSRVYLIVLSTLDSPHEVAAGLAAGADVYMSKRSSDGELLANLATARRTIALALK
jgi:DNA-binding response OmpR family regulator